jgi:hypothetical protein
MARVWKPHCAEQFFVGGLKKGACEEWVASHIRVTAAPSFCERRLVYRRRIESESQAGIFRRNSRTLVRLFFYFLTSNGAVALLVRSDLKGYVLML